MTAYDQRDPRMCDCCRFPICMGATSGRGNVCAGCLAHYEEAFGVLSPRAGEEEQQRREQDHEAIAAMVDALEDYYRRHTLLAEDGSVGHVHV